MNWGAHCDLKDDKVRRARACLWMLTGVGLARTAALRKSRCVVRACLRVVLWASRTTRCGVCACVLVGVDWRCHGAHCGLKDVKRCVGCARG